jgi:hypothetical protein
VELAGGGDTYTAEATHAQTDVVCTYDEALGVIDCA